MPVKVNPWYFHLIVFSIKPIAKESHECFGALKPRKMSDSKISKDFMEYCRKVLNCYRWIGVSQIGVGRTTDGTNFVYQEKSKFIQFVYFVFNFNFCSKFAFLLIQTLVQLCASSKSNVLDQIALLDYMLCCVIVTYVILIWKRPIYEIISQLWVIQNHIHYRIGYPPNMQEDIRVKHRNTVLIHLGIAIIGCGSLGIQFYSDPKHCTFTYSAIASDTSILRFIFCCHEILFMAHGWFCNAGTNCMVTIIANNLFVTMKCMTIALKEITPKPPLIHSKFKETTIKKRQNIGQTDTKTNLKTEAKTDAKKPTHKMYTPQRTNETFRVCKNPKYSPFDELLTNYQQLFLATKLFNDYIAYKLAALIFAGYSQYIASTCMAFQVIRSGHGDIGDIWFYLQDCIISCYHAYRVFNNMSHVLSVADQFFQLMKYFQARHHMERRDRAKCRALRKISMNIGSGPVSRMTVLNSMESLISYYLCVALW